MSLGLSNIIVPNGPNAKLSDIFGLNRLGVRAKLSFSVAQLFAAGEQGVWFEPSPTTCFTDTAGTTPAQVGQAVALMLDKSKGLALGPELVDIDDLPTPSINTAAGASPGTWTPETRTMSTSSLGTNAVHPRFFFNLGLVAGRRYLVQGRLSGSINSLTTPAVRLNILGNDHNITYSASNGEFFSRQIAGSAGIEFLINGTLHPVSLVIEELSIRELPGNHATQPTLASRPILGRVPARGRVNLLERTEEFDNAAWTKSNVTVTANATTAPNGTASADRIAEDTSTNLHVVFSSTVAGSSGQNTVSFFVKPNGRNWVNVRIDGSSAFFDIANGVVGTVSSGNTASMVDVGNGWYRCSVSRNTSTASAVAVRLAADNNVDNYTGDGTSGIFIWGAQLEEGSTATNYQKVTDQFDVTEAGQPNNFYLFHGGSGNPRWMQTPSIDFTGTDKMSVFAGVRKLSDATLSILVDLSNSGFATNGAFGVSAPDTINPNYGFYMNGTVGTAVRATTFAAPITNVLSCNFDIAEPDQLTEIRPRVDGQIPTLQGAGGASAGTGNFRNDILYIGARAGTGSFLNGHIHSLIVRGALTDTPTIERTERYVASKTAGVSIP